MCDDNNDRNDAICDTIRKEQQQTTLCCVCVWSVESEEHVMLYCWQSLVKVVKSRKKRRKHDSGGETGVVMWFVVEYSGSGIGDGDTTTAIITDGKKRESISNGNAS